MSSDGGHGIEPCANKLRFLALVVNTGDLINEKTTPTLGINHAICAPVAIFSVYLFLGCFLISSLFKQYGSILIQVYGLLMCTIIECIVAYGVFSALSKHKVENKYGALVLTGVLPVIISLLLVADLVITLLSTRDQSTNQSLPVGTLD